MHENRNVDLSLKGGEGNKAEQMTQQQLQCARSRDTQAHGDQQPKLPTKSKQK